MIFTIVDSFQESDENEENLQFSQKAETIDGLLSVLGEAVRDIAIIFNSYSKYIFSLQNRSNIFQFMLFFRDGTASPGRCLVASTYWSSLCTRRTRGGDWAR